MGEGGLEGVTVDAQLLGGLPQSDLASELVGPLGQLLVLPVDAWLREAFCS